MVRGLITYSLVDGVPDVKDTGPSHRPEHLETSMATTSFVRGPWTPLELTAPLDGLLHGSAGTLTSLDPATGEVVATVSEAGTADADAAVAAARHAFETSRWRNDGALRARVLHRWTESMRAASGRLAELLTREQGKTLGQAHGEVAGAINMIDYNAGQARALYGRSLALSPTAHGVVLREPVGVVAAITPWNYPLNLTIRAVAPALAAGNAVVVKPASLTPAIVVAALHLLAADPELPEGILTAVAGPGSSVGDRLVTHPDVDMIAFTGDSVTGIRIMKRAADDLKKVSLELGGKSPNVVFADAPWDKALAGAANAVFSAAGQICTAGSRLLVAESIAERFVAELAERTTAMRVGDGLDPSVAMGPLVSAGQLRTVLEYVDIAKADGTVLVGGERLTSDGLADGNFVAPTIVTDLDPSSRLLSEEVFGPVLAVQTFADEDEAIALANSTSFGLAAGLWTTDVDRAWRVGRAIRSGTIWINTYHHFYAEMEVGGFGQSGLGRQQGVEGLLEFTETKHLNFDHAPTLF